MGTISSYFKALKASRCFGAALKYERRGDFKNALKKARDGLKILASPGMIRSNPAESSLLVNLTILIEQITNGTSEIGVSERDLFDTYLSIKSLEGTEVCNNYIDWLRYIEDKLGYVPTKSQQE